MLRTTGEGIFFFDSRPVWRRRSHRRVFLSLIRMARQSITISMAYFLPTSRVQRALYRARKRGVRVRVVVPAESDVRVIQWATRHLYARLLRRGIEVYERQKQMLKRFDKNGDGKIDESERAEAEKAREQFQQNQEKRRAEMLKRFDKDGDGVLNAEEQAAAQKFREEMMQRRGEGRPGAENRPGAKKKNGGT